MDHKAHVKRLVAHSEGCVFADEEQTDQFFVAGTTIYRDAIGRKGSESWSWNTYLCNDPDCPGIVAVRYDVISEVIAAALAS